MRVRNYSTSKARREALEKELDITLPSIASYTSALEVATTKNCENMIGAAQVPLGIAGPLRIATFQFQIPNKENKEYYIPLATTEGALVASINRGCKAITKAGGAIVDVSKFGVTRGPVFYTGSIREKLKFHDYIERSREEIRKVAEATSKHLRLKDIFIKSLPNYTFLRFSYDTEDAMGMNMATIATQAVVELIEKETGTRCLSVAGNFDIDKKPAWINAIMQRGIKAWAEVVLEPKILTDILKTDARRFFDTWLAKCMLGSAVAGSIGFNAHIANVLAAMFIATGQDPAHVVEGSLGVTTARVLDDDSLYVGVFLPCLLVGTVGGGTSLPTQKEALSILGLFSPHSRLEQEQSKFRQSSTDSKFYEDEGQGKVEEFAGIIAAACLAGEISLLSSLSEGSLARAHERLGRSKLRIRK